MEQKPYDMHMILNYIRGLYKVLEPDWMKISNELDLTTSELHALWVIDYGEKITMSKIAEIGLWDISTVMAVVKRIEKKGLVTVSKSGPDKRVTYVRLTDSGLEKKNKAASLFKTFRIDQYLDDLWNSNERSKENVQAILNFAKEINEHFHSEEYSKWLEATSPEAYKMPQ